MASDIRPNLDSREGFEDVDWEEYAEWEAGLVYDDDYADYDDGQPDEYTEWQDVYGGDDWDHGQYDHYDEY